MKKTLIAVLAALLVPASSLAAFDITDITTKYSSSDAFSSQINSGLEDFTDQLAIAVPQAATQQNVWADAYIGKLFPSVPMHFGGGFNLGVTHIDTSGLASAAKALGISGIKDNYYFPVFTADLRIGGVFLPFDVDIAVMKTPTLSTEFGCNLDVDLMTFGMDVRYAILEGNLLLPKLSVGVGYFYNQGTFNASESHAEATIDYKVHTLYGQVQVSKNLLFVTPFFGFRALVSNYDNTYNWAFTDSSLVAQAAAAYYETSGSGSSTSDGFDFGGMQPQVFAGVGFNFLVLQTTLSVTADLRHVGDSGLWSGAFSVRVKI